MVIASGVFQCQITKLYALNTYCFISQVHPNKPGRRKQKERKWGRVICSCSREGQGGLCHILTHACVSPSCVCVLPSHLCMWVLLSCMPVVQVNPIHVYLHIYAPIVCSHLCMSPCVPPLHVCALMCFRHVHTHACHYVYVCLRCVCSHVCMSLCVPPCVPASSMYMHHLHGVCTPRVCFHHICISCVCMPFVCLPLPCVHACTYMCVPPSCMCVPICVHTCDGGGHWHPQVYQKRRSTRRSLRTKMTTTEEALADSTSSSMPSLSTVQAS